MLNWKQRKVELGSCLSEGNFVLVSISKDMKNSTNIDNDITKSEKHIFTHRETVTSKKR